MADVSSLPRVTLYASKVTLYRKESFEGLGWDLEIMPAGITRHLRIHELIESLSEFPARNKGE